MSYLQCLMKEITHLMMNTLAPIFVAVIGYASATNLFLPTRIVHPNQTLRYSPKPAIWKLQDSHSHGTVIRPQYVRPFPDQNTAASEHGHHSRVHIKVFRGPDAQNDHFAPHGYWVKHPEDHGRDYRR